MKDIGAGEATGEIEKKDGRLGSSTEDNEDYPEESAEKYTG